MANVYTRIGYIKGATGATGATGAKGDTGDAATIEVGSVTTVPYGQTANVVNSGTEQAAVFDFTIPQGRPGQQVTEMDNLLLNSITTSAASFPLPAVGETGKVLWGKVVKWFSDMAALVATKLNAANVVNNLTTTASGYALDARQGKVLNDKLNIYHGVLGGNMSKELPNGGNSMTLIGSITLPSTVSVYLVMAHAQLNVASNNGLMQMDLGGRVVRSITKNGGGVVNFATINGGTISAVKGYVSDVENATMSISWAAYPLY